jgi:1,4-dihydroxy-2-naphthoyl-CoA hydrolase
VTPSSDSASSQPSPSGLREYQKLASRGLAEALGIEIIELGPERVVATMPVDDRTRQPFGVLHGGAAAALIETAASLGAWRSIDSALYRAVGIEINVNHIRSKADGVVRVVATPLHQGRMTQVWSAEIRDEAGRLISAGRCTLAVVPAGAV